MLETVSTLSSVVIIAILGLIAVRLTFLVNKLKHIEDPQWARGVNENGQFVDDNGDLFPLPDPMTPEFDGVWGRLDYIACSLQLQNQILARSGHFPSLFPRANAGDSLDDPANARPTNGSETPDQTTRV